MNGHYERKVHRNNISNLVSGAIDFLTRPIIIQSKELHRQTYTYHIGKSDGYNLVLVSFAEAFLLLSLKSGCNFFTSFKIISSNFFTALLP